MPNIDPGQDLDLSLLNEIADGSNEFMVESIDMFVEQTPDMLKAVSDLIAQKEWLNAGLAAHKIKATLGFFGMLETQSLIQQVELACKAGGQSPYEIIVKFNKAKATIATNMISLLKLKEELQAK